MVRTYNELFNSTRPREYDGSHIVFDGMNPDIIDDLGVERSNEYAMEQMFSIVDSRYRSGTPLIVTTNLKLDELKHLPDLAHARIYDRILERCAPILFAGKNFRADNAASTKAAARQIITSPTASHRRAATKKGEL